MPFNCKAEIIKRLRFDRKVAAEIIERLRFDRKRKAIEATIKLLPPGANAADARAALSALAVFWEHVPARFPDGLPVPVTAD